MEARADHNMMKKNERELNNYLMATTWPHAMGIYTFPVTHISAWKIH